MKKLGPWAAGKAIGPKLFLGLAMVLGSSGLSASLAQAESCDIEKIIGAKVSPGYYKVNVKRETNNMYKVTGQDIYIKTRMCLNLALGDDAILEIKYPSGYMMGEIHFLR